MANHACTCCSQCQHELISLRSRHQELLADYSSLLRKQQLTQQLESAYQQHQSTTSDALSQQQQTIEQHQRTINDQNARIHNLENQLQQMNLSLQKYNQGRTSTSVEDGDFRKEVTRSQQLNRTIDSKNRDIMELQRQVAGLPLLQSQYQQLQRQHSHLAEQLLTTQNSLREIDVERQRLRARIQTMESGEQRRQYEQPVRKSWDRPVVNRSQFLQPREQRESRDYRDYRSSISPNVSSTLGGGKVTAGMSNLGSMNLREVRRQDRSDQLWLIRSRIQELQAENNKLRGELSSVI